MVTDCGRTTFGSFTLALALLWAGDAVVVVVGVVGVAAPAVVTVGMLGLSGTDRPGTGQPAAVQPGGGGKSRVRPSDKSVPLSTTAFWSKSE